MDGWALAIALIAAAAGVGGAFVGARIGANAAKAVAKEQAGVTREVAQDDRDAAREARDQERRDARLDRFADRKLSLVVGLLLTADLHADQARQQVAGKERRWRYDLDHAPDQVDDYGQPPVRPAVPDVGPSQPVRNAMLALELVAPRVAHPAEQFYLVTVKLGELASRWQDPDTDRLWDMEWEGADIAWSAARAAFVDAVRDDLGVAPVPD